MKLNVVDPGDKRLEPRLFMSANDGSEPAALTGEFDPTVLQYISPITQDDRTASQASALFPLSSAAVDSALSQATGRMLQSKTYYFVPGTAKREVNVSYDVNAKLEIGSNVHGPNGQPFLFHYALDIPPNSVIKSIRTETDYAGGFGAGNYYGKFPKGNAPGLSIVQELLVGSRVDRIDRLEMTEPSGYYNDFSSRRAPPTASSYSSGNVSFESGIYVNAPASVQIRGDAGTALDVRKFIVHVEFETAPVLFEDLAEIPARLSGTVEELGWTVADTLGMQYSKVEGFQGNARAAKQLVADYPLGVGIVEPRDEGQFAVVTQIAAGTGYLVGMERQGNTFRWMSDNSVAASSFWATYHDGEGRLRLEPNDDDGSATNVYANGEGKFDDDDPTRTTQVIVQRPLTSALLSSVTLVTRDRSAHTVLRLKVDGTEAAAAVGTLIVDGSAGASTRYFLILPGQNEIDLPIDLQPGMTAATVGIAGLNGIPSVEDVLLLTDDNQVTLQLDPALIVDEQTAPPGTFFPGVYVPLAQARAEYAGFALGVAQDYPEVRDFLPHVDAAHPIPTPAGKTSLDFGLQSFEDLGPIPQTSSEIIWADFEAQFDTKRSGWDRFLDGFTSVFVGFGKIFADPGEVFEGFGHSVSAFFRNPVKYVGAAFQGLATPEGLGSLLGGTLFGAVVPQVPFLKVVQNPVTAITNTLAPSLGVVGEIGQTLTALILNPAGTVVSTVGTLLPKDSAAENMSPKSTDTVNYFPDDDLATSGSIWPEDVTTSQSTGNILPHNSMVLPSDSPPATPKTQPQTPKPAISPEILDQLLPFFEPYPTILEIEGGEEGLEEINPITVASKAVDAKDLWDWLRGAKQSTGRGGVLSKVFLVNDVFEVGKDLKKQDWFMASADTVSAGIAVAPTPIGPIGTLTVDLYAKLIDRTLNEWKTISENNTIQFVPGSPAPITQFGPFSGMSPIPTFRMDVMPRIVFGKKLVSIPVDIEANANRT